MAVKLDRSITRVNANGADVNYVYVKDGGANRLVWAKPSKELTEMVIYRPPVEFPVDMWTTVPIILELPAGRYLLEIWGADGGASTTLTETWAPGVSETNPPVLAFLQRGRGGYCRGEIELPAGVPLNVYLGGHGGRVFPLHQWWYNVGGFNGGGWGGGAIANGFAPGTNTEGTRSWRQAAGGGATHIAIGELGELFQMRNTPWILNLIIVAGGGGAGGGDREIDNSETAVPHNVGRGHGNIVTASVDVPSTPGFHWIPTGIPNSNFHTTSRPSLIYAAVPISPSAINGRFPAFGLGGSPGGTNIHIGGGSGFFGGSAAGGTSGTATGGSPYIQHPGVLSRMNITPTISLQNASFHVYPEGMENNVMALPQTFQGGFVRNPLVDILNITGNRNLRLMNGCARITRLS